MLANSFMDCENTVDLRNVLAMFESVGEYSKSQRLRFRDGFVACGAVRKYAGKIGSPVKMIVVAPVALSLFATVRPSAASEAGLRK